MKNEIWKISNVKANHKEKNNSSIPMKMIGLYPYAGAGSSLIGALKNNKNFVGAPMNLVCNFTMIASEIKNLTMNKIILLGTSLIFFLSCSDLKKAPRSIKVSGEGKIRVKPDLVILSIDVSFIQPRMADAVRLSQQTVDSVVAILSTFGDKKNDIKTSSISANKEYNYERDRSVFVGYKAQQSIDFVLNDISKFTNLTAKLLTTKINSISQVQFGHSKADSLLREADLLAYDDALKSAQKLCDRANTKLGKLLYLTNAETDFYPTVYSNTANINTFNKSYGGEGFKISPEVLVFRRKIVSEYEMSN